MIRRELLGFLRGIRETKLNCVLSLSLEQQGFPWLALDFDPFLVKITHKNPHRANPLVLPLILVRVADAAVDVVARKTGSRFINTRIIILQFSLSPFLLIQWRILESWPSTQAGERRTNIEDWLGPPSCEPSLFRVDNLVKSSNDGRRDVYRFFNLSNVRV